MEHLGSWIPQVDLDYILDSVIKYEDIDVDQTEKNLVDAGCLSLETGWSKFSNMPSESEEEGAETFVPLKEIREQLIEHASFIGEMIKPDPTLIYLKSASGSSLPKGYGRLNESNPNSTVSSFKRAINEVQENILSEVALLDIGYAEEHSEGNDPTSKDLMIEDIVQHIESIMWNDPRRRYTFGVTFVDTETRLWFGCRQAVIVSKPFDFMKEPRKFVRLFTSLTFASPTQLGWDPTMTLVKGPGATWSYDIQVHTKNPDENVTFTTYRTEGFLSNPPTDLLRGRVTRVFKARLLDKDNITVGEPVALKDFWQDEGLRNEVEILNDILEGASEKERQYFLTVVAHGSVVIEGKDDHTLNHIMGGDQFHYPDRSAGPPNQQDSCFILQSEVAEELAYFYSGNYDGDEYDDLAPWAFKAERDHFKLPHSTHMRIVFKEVCETLWTVESAKQLFLAVQHAVKALEFLASKNYVHRDISPGNILLFNGRQGKLSDLESVMQIGTDSQQLQKGHETGTVGYISNEIVSSKYRFLPDPDTDLGPRTTDISLSEMLDIYERSPPPHFMYNPLHDLESVWWVAVWGLVWSGLPPINDVFPQSYEEADAQMRFAKRLYNPESDDDYRFIFFDLDPIFENLGNLIPSAYLPYVVILSRFRNILLWKYTDYVAGRKLNEEVLKDVHAEIHAVLEYAQENDDCVLFSLDDIHEQLTKKRELPSSSTTTGSSDAQAL